MENINPEEQVESYLLGTLDDRQRSDFENALKNNPDLQSELKFQQQIITGIRDYRKTQLKARLDQVVIPAGGVSNYFSTLGAKVAGSVIVASIGIGIFYFANTDDNSNVAIQQEFPTPVEIPESPLPTQPDEEEIVVAPKETSTFNEDQVEVSSADPDNPIATESVSEVVANEIPAVADNSSDEVSISDEEQFFTPEIDLPEDDFDPSETDFSQEEELTEDVGNPVTLGTSLINIEVAGPANTRSFRYFEGKLSLFGDFSESPYEILELNADDERQVYLYYDGDYHKIFLTRVTIPLKKLEDRALVLRLEGLRNP